MAGEVRKPVSVNGEDDWERSIDEVLAICDGDTRAALRTLLIANAYLDAEVERLQTLISKGYSRRRRE